MAEVVAKSEVRDLEGARQSTHRISMCLGALCALSLIGLAVTGLFAASLVVYLEKYDVCNPVFENFDDASLVPEITSIGIGVVSVANSQLRHGIGDDFFDPLLPVEVIFDPARPPTYVGVTGESVGRNGLRIQAFSCEPALLGTFDVLKSDVDDGPQEYILAQLGNDSPICRIDISQKLSLPGDGTGISQIVMAYPCKSGETVVDFLPYDFLREQRVNDVVVTASITGVLLMAFIGLAVYRHRRLK